MITVIMLALALLSVYSDKGFAVALEPFEAIETGYWENSNWIATDTFSYHQKPWVFFKIPGNYVFGTFGGNYNGGIVNSTWVHLASAFSQDTVPAAPYVDWDPVLCNGNNGHYLSFTDNRWFGLNGNPEVRRVGDWSINLITVLTNDGNYVTTLGGNISKMTITPEPASVALFLLGGIGLVAGRLRKKK